jgi:phage terminase small subunit
MPARSPLRDKAFELWQASGRERLLKDIAAELGVSESQIRKWKSQDQWESAPVLPLPTRRGNVTIARLPPASEQKALEAAALDDADLTEKQKLFCLYYLRDFNATHAAIKAGYSPDTARQMGSENLSKPAVRAEIKRLKGVTRTEILLDSMDVLEKYAQIAFADTTQFVTFGRREVPVMGPFGPLEDDDGNPVMQTVNYVDVAESAAIDGTIISEVSQGRDGIKVKLNDRMKALEKLEKFFDLLPDKWKRQLEERKLELEAQKAGMGNDDVDTEDDGFLTALQGEAPEVWGDGDDEDEGV